MKKIIIFFSLFFCLLTAKAQVLSIGIDSVTGSPMYRQLDYFVGGVIDPKITVYYRQWLLTPSGKRYNEENQRTYFVMDIPAVYTYDTVLVLPADMKYTEWRTKQITAPMIGAKLGDDIIIGRINYILKNMPINVADKIINP